MPRHEFVIVYITTPDAKTANNIARKLIQDKLAACVNIISRVRSIYQWKGKIETSSELLLVVKTRRSLLRKMQNAVLKIHPYEAPEFIAVPLIYASPFYAKWLGEACKTSIMKEPTA